MTISSSTARQAIAVMSQHMRPAQVLVMLADIITNTQGNTSYKQTLELLFRVAREKYDDAHHPGESHEA